MEYKTYKARLQYKDRSEYIAPINARNIAEVKDILSKEYSINPFYTAILDDKGNTVYNNHLPVENYE